MPDQIDCKNELDPNFIETIQILNEQKISYWIFQGTLLGIIRDNNLIPWDSDIDIAVWSGSISKKQIKDLMLSNGYELKDDGNKYDYMLFNKEGGKFVDINFFKLSKDRNIVYTEWDIPNNTILAKIIYKILVVLNTLSQVTHLNVFYYLEGKIRNKLSPLITRTGGYSMPIKYLNSFSNYECKNLLIRIPSDYIKVLEYLYGNDWETPKMDYKWEDSQSVVYNFDLKQ
jgi:lipopolysaccharide cholinephosphotransferase